MATTYSRQRIVARIKPCTCGCCGRDPWHAPKFIRAVRSVQPQQRGTTVKVCAFSEPIEIDALGLVDLPFGETQVARSALTGSWYVW